MGTTREAGNHVVVEIDDFEPLESEHASGPSYVLSDADLGRLEARIAAHEDPESSSVVGFYRSHTRGDFAITAEDASLFSRYFPAASHVFLLIKSHDDGPPTGGFLIREGGKVLSDSPYAEFPLPLPDGMANVRGTHVPTVSTAPARPTAAPLVPPPARRRTAWMVRRPVWLAAGGVVALAVALSIGMPRRSPGSVPARPGPSLALNVTDAGNSLRLSWDRQSARRAGNAVLWIKDGHEEQRFELDSKQLSEGSVVYWPRNSDVNFRLEMLSPGANATESVRAIGGPGSPPARVPQPVVAAVQTPPAARPMDTKRPAVASARKSAGQPGQQRIRTASQHIPRAFAAPQPETDSAPVVSAPLPDPPTGKPAVSPPLEHHAELLQRIAAAKSLGGGADPAVRVSAEPASGSLLEHLGRNIPLIGKRYRRADYVPPVPLHSPAFPDPPPRSLAKRVGIDVKVYVNPAGTVDYAEVLSKLAPTDRDLAALAVFSARRWEFVPARTGNGAVPGTVILHFQFGPAAPVTGSQAFAAR
jgi:hypothetical protein